MDLEKSRRSAMDHRTPRRRSRSASCDTDEERRRRRRRKEREAEDRDKDRAGMRGSRERESLKDRENKWDTFVRRDREKDDRITKRRRSRSPRSPRSPRHKSSHRHRDRDSRKDEGRDRSPYMREKQKEHRSSREGSSNQVSRKAKGPLPSQEASFQADKDPSTAMVVAGDVPEKLKPTLASTGLLAAASNSVTQADGTTIALKYHEPPEARKPPAKDDWKLFVFKGADILETIELSLRSCWLVGREVAVVDLPAEHPSISKQHAVLQFRFVERTNEYGDKLGRVRPYLIDLESANGTLLNKVPAPPSRYLELRDKDLIQFGHSTREYVLMLSPK